MWPLLGKRTLSQRRHCNGACKERLSGGCVLLLVLFWVSQEPRILFCPEAARAVPTTPHPQDLDRSGHHVGESTGPLVGALDLPAAIEASVFYHCLLVWPGEVVGEHCKESHSDSQGFVMVFCSSGKLVLSPSPSVLLKITILEDLRPVTPWVTSIVTECLQQVLRSWS